MPEISDSILFILFYFSGMESDPHDPPPVLLFAADHCCPLSKAETKM
jgi:hypothetical protein